MSSARRFANQRYRKYLYILPVGITFIFSELGIIFYITFQIQDIFIVRGWNCRLVPAQSKKNNYLKTIYRVNRRKKEHVKQSLNDTSLDKNGTGTNTSSEIIAGLSAQSPNIPASKLSPLSLQNAVSLTTAHQQKENGSTGLKSALDEKFKNTLQSCKAEDGLFEDEKELRKRVEWESRVWDLDISPAPKTHVEDLATVKVCEDLVSRYTALKLDTSKEINYRCKQAMSYVYHQLEKGLITKDTQKRLVAELAREKYHKLRAL